MTDCNCESMNGRFGAHRPECPWQIEFKKQAEEISEILGPCGCVDYHMSDCPLRTAAIDNLSLQEYNEGRYYDDLGD